MSENEIVNILGDIRSSMFNILDGNLLTKVLNVIDEKMELYRGMTNEEIAKILGL